MSRDAPIICSESDGPAVEGTLEVLGHLRIEHETLMMSVNCIPSAGDLEADLVAAGVAALSTNWLPSPTGSGGVRNGDLHREGLRGR